MSSNPTQPKNKSKQAPRRRPKNSTRPEPEYGRQRNDQRSTRGGRPQNYAKAPMDKKDSSYAKGRPPTSAMKITSEMKKLRDVPARFTDNKKNLIQKYKALGINDDQNWSTAGGEGLTYEQLLRMPIYSDSDNTPENAIKEGSDIIFKEEPLNWDNYFKAIQQNFQVGFTSRYKNNPNAKDNRARQEKQDPSGKSEIYNDTAIEWDEIQQPSEASDKKETPKKYKMKFKQITDNEKSEIMKKIETEGTDYDPLTMTSQGDKSPNIANMLMNAVGAEPTKDIANSRILSIEELEGALTSSNSALVNMKSSKSNIRNVRLDSEEKIDEEFFKDDSQELENQFAICKENTEANDDDDEEIEFAEVDVSEIKNHNKSTTFPSKMVNQETPKEKETTAENSESPLIPSGNQKILTVEELERQHVKSEPEIPKNEDIQTQNIPKVQKPQKAMSQSQLPQTLNQSQNLPSAPEMMNQSQAYHHLMQNQNDLQTQQMINQLNQNEIKNVIMQNPAFRSQYGQSMQDYSYEAHSPDVDLNPFEVLLRDDPTSQWFYKDPQGMIQGPFTCFDMNTWYTQGYFSEDLEVSMDYTNFFRLCDLRMYIQNSIQASSQAQYSHQPPVQQNNMYGYGMGSPDPQMQYSQMSGYINQNLAYQQYSHGSQNANPYSSYAQNHSAYGSTTDQQNYYSHMGDRGQHTYGPYYGHQ